VWCQKHHVKQEGYLSKLKGAPICPLIMIVPDRLNHRRRVVYAALRKALDRDQRIPKLFIFWDRTFANLDHFVISPYIEQAAARGLLSDQEKRELTRALMHYMSHDYHDLPKYPEEFVNFKPKNPVLSVSVTPVPSTRSSQVSPPKVPLASLKMTITPEMSPSYLVFREVMAVELRLLRDAGRSPEEMKRLVLKSTEALDKPELEPLLQTWSESIFSLESLPILSESAAMQALIQVFYQAACEALTTPLSTPTLPERAPKTEIPEIVR
jgi:hypothetical protein